LQYFRVIGSPDRPVYNCIVYKRLQAKPPEPKMLLGHVEVTGAYP